jgi:predicted metalloprotease with PDZ domain
MLGVSDYARRLSSGLNTVVNSPGRRFFSPVEMSMQAPFVDEARAVDPTNGENTFISYYSWGSVIGLNLDLTLRSRFDLTLDGYMQAVWEQFGKTEIPYTVDDLESVLGAFTEDEEFATEFFARYVRGREVPDYEALLANAGFLLRRAHLNEAWLGDTQLQYADSSATLTTTPPIGSPLYKAGISRGDRIVSIDGLALTNADVLREVLDGHGPGNVVDIRFEQRRIMKTAAVTLAANQRLEVILYEDAGLPLTEDMQAFRQRWLTGNQP